MPKPLTALLTRSLAASVLALSLLLSSCSAGHTATPAQRSADRDSIVVGTTGVPASMDFTTSSGAAIPQALMSNIYETLVRINQDGQIVPWLATHWEVSPDQRRYTFHLRHNVRFSNGEAFTAETAKFSIDRVRSNAWTNGLKKGMDVVEDTKVVDTFTLAVTLSHRSNSWLYSMGTLIGAMMTPTGVTTVKTNPIGTGPYTLTSWAQGESVSFTARSDYWGIAPEMSHATIRYYADAIASTNALRTGDVDVVWNMQSPELLDTLSERFGVQVGTTNGELLLSMNNKRAPFNDVAVRQAVLYALDREALNQVVYEGLATDTGGVPVPPTDPWYFKAQRYPFDPQKARELLAGRTPSITISVPSLPYAQQASELIYSQLEDVGFQVRLESTEFPAVWLAKVMQRKDYDMSLIAHVEARDFPTFFGSPDYYLGVDDNYLQQELRAADSGPASEEIDHMKVAARRELEIAGAANLLNIPNIVLTAPGVTGVNANAITDALPLAEMGRAQ